MSNSVRGKKINKQTPIPPDLHGHIMRGVSRARARRHARYSAFFFAGLLGLGYGLFSAVSALACASARSGFWSYLSVLFSGDVAVRGVWKELLLSLGESLPAWNALSVFAVLFLLVWLARAWSKRAVRVFRAQS